MTLEDVYKNIPVNYSHLYLLLKERKDYESISHNDMPTWKEHEEFVNRKPYRSWFIIYEILNGKATAVGSLYITYKNEIGIAIYEKYRRKGYAYQAIQAFTGDFKDADFYANINPANQKSIDLFTKLGFTHIQSTYKRGRKSDVGA